MKICSRCGSENEDYVKFCVQCGKSFDNTDNHFEVVEEPSLIKKIFYKFDEEKHKYRIAKIKSFLVVEAVAIFIWAFNDLWFYIDSSKGDIFCKFNCCSMYSSYIYHTFCSWTFYNKENLSIFTVS